MKNRTIQIVISLMAFAAGLPLMAQPRSDTLRTHTWAVGVEAGGGLFHGLHSSEALSRPYATPSVTAGLYHQIAPTWRISGHVGYTYLHWNDKWPQESHSPTVDAVRFDSRHYAHLLHLDGRVDYDMMRLFLPRKSRAFHLFAGGGAGFMTAWTHHDEIWAYEETMEASGNAGHNYVEYTSHNNRWGAFYLPVHLSAELDLLESLTAKAGIAYKWLPFATSHAPKGMVCTTLGVIYHFTRRLRERTLLAPYREEIASLNRQVNTLRAAQVQQAEAATALQAKQHELEVQLAACEKKPRVAHEPKEWGRYALFFAKHSASISPTTRGHLHPVIQVLHAHPEVHVTLQGYASPEGSVRRNIRLSEKRAKAVADYLVKEGGVARTRIRMEGCGPTDTLYAQFELNRVVILQLSSEP